MELLKKFKNEKNNGILSATRPKDSILKTGIKPGDVFGVDSDGTVNAADVLAADVLSVKVENPDLLLRPGMTANVEITVRNDKDVLVIPNTAFRFIPPVVEEQPKEKRGFVDSLFPHPPRMRGRRPIEQQKPEKEGQRCIYTLEKDINGEEQLVQHWITVGDSDGSHSEVLEGDIKPGMPIVLEILKNRRKE